MKPYLYLMHWEAGGNLWNLFAQVDKEYYFVTESSRSNPAGGKESLLLRLEAPQKMLTKFC